MYSQYQIYPKAEKETENSEVKIKGKPISIYLHCTTYRSFYNNVDIISNYIRKLLSPCKLSFPALTVYGFSSVAKHGVHTSFKYL